MMNILTRKPLPRRTLLRGAGLSLALPWLEAMLPRTVSAQVMPQYFFGFFFPNGTIPALWQPPTGKILQSNLPVCLQDLAGFGPESFWPATTSLINDVSVITNLDHDVYNTEIHSPSMALQAHRRGAADNTLPPVAKSLDVKIAEKDAGKVPYQYLSMSASGESTASQTILSWEAKSQPGNIHRSPSALFNTLFGAAQDTEAANQIKSSKRSLVDFLREDTARLKNQLGQSDQDRVDEYLESLYSLEAQLKVDALACPTNGLNGTEVNWHDKSKFFIDIGILAMQCDLTHVAMLQYSNSWGVNYNGYDLSNGVVDASGRIGVAWLADHTVSHRVGFDGDTLLSTLPKTQAAEIANNRVVMATRFKVRRFAYLVDRLRNTRLPTGASLLDNALALYFSEIGDGASHARVKMPTLLAGRAGGFRPGYAVNAGGQKTGALHGAILQKFGFNISTYGDPAVPPMII
jgi:Protein of unknown function (DUF1552)